MIFVAGHKGMVGSSILRRLNKNGNEKVLTRTRNELDLTDQKKVLNFFDKERPTQVYLAAAKVGGIHANNEYPADFIFDNLMIQANIINSAFHSGVKKLLFLGSSCIYPAKATQPIRESELLTGQLESTNEPYAISKISGIKLCESYNRQYGNSHKIDYRCIMPTNLYGPGDNYHKENSHVIPALLRRFHEAKENNLQLVKVWGSGEPRREFLHVDDLAEAAFHIMNIEKKIFSKMVKPRLSHINVGFGEDLKIKELAELISKVVGFKGNIVFDKSKPDGTFQKLLDNSLIRSMGWMPKIDLEKGLKATYKDVLNFKIFRE